MVRALPCTVDWNHSSIKSFIGDERRLGTRDASWSCQNDFRSGSITGNSRTVRRGQGTRIFLIMLNGTSPSCCVR